MRSNPFQGTVFLRGVAGSGQLPPDNGREVAIAGRSNVGKSSVINALAGQRLLARASRTPGRTRELNFFEVRPGARLVDLPGYGYARVAQEQRRHWGELLADYLARRRSLAGVVVVMDIRHPFRELDELLLRLLEEARIPSHIVLNKSDKLRASEARAAVRSALDPGRAGVTAQSFSSIDGTGVGALRIVIERWLDGDAGAKKMAPVHRGR